MKLFNLFVHCHTFAELHRMDMGSILPCPHKCRLVYVWRGWRELTLPFSALLQAVWIPSFL